MADRRAAGSPTTLRLTLTERKFVFAPGFCGKAAGANLFTTANDAKWTPPFGECACSTSVHERGAQGAPEERLVISVPRAHAAFFSGAALPIAWRYTSRSDSASSRSFGSFL